MDAEAEHETGSSKDAVCAGTNSKSLNVQKKEIICNRGATAFFLAKQLGFHIRAYGHDDN